MPPATDSVEEAARRYLKEHHAALAADEQRERAEEEARRGTSAPPVKGCRAERGVTMPLPAARLPRAPQTPPAPDAADEGPSGEEMALAAGQGVYSDPTGSVEVNIQTAEVYLRGRMVMPVPDDIAAMDDFQAVFGTSKPLCAMIANQVCCRPRACHVSRVPPRAVPTPRALRPVAPQVDRRWIQIYDGGFIYDIAAWTPVLSTAAGAAAEEAAAQRIRSLIRGVKAAGDAGAPGNAAGASAGGGGGGRGGGGGGGAQGKL